MQRQASAKIWARSTLEQRQKNMSAQCNTSNAVDDSHVVENVADAYFELTRPSRLSFHTIVLLQRRDNAVSG